MNKSLLTLAVLSFLLVLGGMCLAEDLDPANGHSEQSIDNQQTYFTANFQKQPQDSKQKQGISNHFTFFTINVQINGKIKDTDTAN